MGVEDHFQGHVLADPERIVVGGNDEVDLDHIFQAFYTTKTDGLGMGLAIALSIVEAHGGRLEARNNPDGGATFAFTLPAADQAS